MKIACLGWGSLIWDPRSLNKTKEEWKSNGPFLPIEFLRISSDNRVTLVIDKTSISKPIQSLWALMNTEDFDEAFTSLKDREGTIAKRIHFVRKEDIPNGEIEEIVKKWLIDNDLDICIWTGLYLNDKKQDKRPEVEDIIEHIKSLEGTEKEKAKEYIVKAPAQIKTEYRLAIEEEFDWK
jgi:hypothetical protein